MAKKDDLEQMRDEAVRRQDNLASDIDELIDRVNPKNAVQRWKNELVGSVKDFSAAGDGESAAPSPAAVIGGVIGLLALGAVVGGGMALNHVIQERRTARAEARRASRRVMKQSRLAAKDVDTAIKHARDAVGEYVAAAGKEAKRRAKG